MSLQEDWYIYHSKDDLNWFLQDGGPYIIKSLQRSGDEKRGHRRAGCQNFISARRET